MSVLCSFCGKGADAVAQMIANPAATAWICGECVPVCDSLLTKRAAMTEEFENEEFAAGYCDSRTNAEIAVGIARARESAGLTQEALASLIGSKQPGISRIEDINYGAWNICTLSKIAAATKMRLKVQFLTRASLIDEVCAGEPAK